MAQLFFTRRGFLFSTVALTLGIKACQSQPQPTELISPSAAQPSQSPTSPVVALYGAGATFPVFLYLRWFDEYKRTNPSIQVSYQPIGSAAGIEQFIAGTVDFGASEVTLTEEQVAQVSKGTVLIPTAAGSIAVVYNLPGIQSGLRLSRQVLPDIFLGKITQWNDPQIADLNPDVTLPDAPITLIHRSDGSGTTAAFTAHLSAISPEWQDTVGTGLNVPWVAGVGIKDNAGISAQIQQAEGTIGYVEYAYAKQLDMAAAALENKTGQFVEPTNETAEAAIASLKLSDNLEGSVPDPEGDNAYPIVTYSWLLAYQQYDDPAKAKALRDVIQWGLINGQTFALELGYVPLPAEVVEKSTAALNQITS
ncbi:MAG: phosphate ABC transporter substrate-binding protein PstS [Cyanobacteria bacterium CRU_2_1]|nr:phosphate ABC transporter substrate-binding protein PstS [Cyanobacteria bacterium CRU_2_1]